MFEVRKMKLSASDSEAHRRRFKLVRTDTCEDVPGEILSADEDTGDCSVSVQGEAKQFSLGHGGLRIVQR